MIQTQEKELNKDNKKFVFGLILVLSAFVLSYMFLNTSVLDGIKFYSSHVRVLFEQGALSQVTLCTTVLMDISKAVAAVLILLKVLCIVSLAFVLFCSILKALSFVSSVFTVKSRRIESSQIFNFRKTYILQSKFLC